MAETGNKQPVRKSRVVADNLLLNTTNSTPAEGLGEMINNSFDANASKVYVKLGQYKGHAAIFILDDGIGFSRDALDAVLGYGDSTRDRSDVKTVGSNGMGIKNALSLGDLQSTKVTIITRSKDFPVGVKTSFDFHLLKETIEQGGLETEKLLERVSNDLGEFYQGFKPRDMGSTIIITGFNKISTNEELREILAARLSPRTASKVWVWSGGINDGKYYLLQTKKVEGTHFQQSYDSEILGKVTFNVYWGGPNTGPMICGRENAITEYMRFITTLSSAEKKQMNHVWKSIGGYVYVPNINVYRLNDGRFLPKFTTSGAKAELITIFELIGAELEKFQEEIEASEKMEEKMNLLRLIVEASRPLNPEQVYGSTGDAQGGTPQPMEIGRMDVPVYIVPNQITIVENESREVVLHNQGYKDLNFRGALWYPDHKSVIVVGNGHSVTIIVGRKKDLPNGVASIRIKGEFGEHILKVQVVERTSAPYIAGPKLVCPGSLTEYYLGNNSESEIKWELTKCFGIRLKPHPQDSHKILLEVDSGIQPQQITLYAEKKNKSIIAQRNIRVTDLSYDKPFTVKIGDQSFAVGFGPRYQTCAVQVEDIDEEIGLPYLFINSIHPLLRDASASTSIDIMLNGMASCAASYLVQNAGITAQQAMNVMWEYVSYTKESIHAASIAKAIKKKSKK